MKFVFAVLAGFIAMFITNGLMSAVVISPLFESRYSSIVANPINYPLLALGYLIIAVAIAIFYPGLRSAQHWLTRSLAIGIPLGLAIFWGTHTVIAGYTTIDTTAFILSGLFDSAGPIIGTIAIGYVYHRTHNQSSVATA